MLYTCAPGCRDPQHRHASAAPIAATTGTAPESPSLDGSHRTVQRAAARRIDVHCHYLQPVVAAKVAHLEPARYDPSTVFANALTRETNQRQMQERSVALTDVNRRLQDMDRMGVDLQVVSPAPFQYYYFTTPSVGATVSREINEGMRALVDGNPGRFAALGTVPLQDAERAMQELAHAMTHLGLRGAEIGTSVNGMDLTDPRLGLERFFALANELEAVLFLHPVGFTEGGRLLDHYLNNVIGNPLETTIAASRLIFDGVAARYPKIKFLLAHGGGYLASYWARMDHAWKARGDCRTVIAEAPSSYLEKMYLDTVVFDPSHLSNLIARYGASQVLMGSDYPYDMGEEDPVHLIERVAGLREEERALILGGNAERIFGLQRETVTTH
ncbi:MAG: amidohydrolase [Hydrogenophaga sp.]|jgi:aminocarboxymuconate-semialdehyde decarboxylase|uniref:amidohydrolase family protein n=1 Tax=Hydrogenophaga sp. TaxID=1904254 RepID=UPI001D35FFBA|nr:amidohydrolase family protein [Hydrogenophaga sp.]MBW0169455.1 amidohydrolase [Hydrogenophaga sp.]MBW0183128.1 amidohydrolase [Hydrogenophaga sp.]